MKAKNLIVALVFMTTGVVQADSIYPECIEEVRSKEIVQAGLENRVSPLDMEDLYFNFHGQDIEMGIFGGRIDNRRVRNARGGVDITVQNGAPVRSIYGGEVIGSNPTNWFRGTGSATIRQDDGLIVRYGFIALSKF